MNRRDLSPLGGRWGANARRSVANDVDNSAPHDPSGQPAADPGVVLSCEDAAQRLDGNRGAFRPTD